MLRNYTESKNNRLILVRNCKKWKVWSCFLKHEQKDCFSLKRKLRDKINGMDFYFLRHEQENYFLGYKMHIMELFPKARTGK